MLALLVLSETLSLVPRERSSYRFRMANSPVGTTRFLLHCECSTRGALPTVFGKSMLGTRLCESTGFFLSSIKT